jgi:hypothetical protein
MMAAVRRSTVSFVALTLSRRRKGSGRSADPSDPVVAGAYVTDGSRLFRVMSRLDPPSGVFGAVLEDCLTLDWRVYDSRELWHMALRPVGSGGRLRVGR